jgi:hypothetical protein
MYLVATVTLEEAKALLVDVLPIKIRLDDDPDAERYLALDEPTLVEMVEGKGLRIGCAGSVVWSLPVIGTVSMHIKKAQAVLVPSVLDADTRATLRFHFDIEALDFEWVPTLVDKGIAEVIEKRLGAKPLEWHVSDTFNRSIPMPASVSPPRAIATAVREPSCSVSNVAMSFVIGVSVTSTKPALV